MMAQIVAIQLKRLDKLLEDRHIHVDLDKDALIFLADKGYDPAYGARPLKRVIQQELQNPMAELLLKGEITDNMRVNITRDGDKLSFKGEKLKKQAA